MTPRKAHGYHRHDRREITVAAAVSAGIFAFTGFMIWALGPHPKSVSQPPTTTVKTVVTTTSTTSTTSTSSSA